MKKYLLALLAAACAAPAAAQDWKFGAWAFYDTGKYGGDTRVDSLYVPLTLKRYYRNADLSVTVPYLRQSSTGPVTRVGGRPIKVAGPARSASSGSESGLGDILVNGSYTVKRDGPGSFDFSLGGRLKLPTANEKKGLGTGQMDQGAGFDFGKELNPRWTLLASGYYTIIGDPRGIDLNNQLDLSVGFYKPLEKDLSLTVLYETSSALRDGNADPRTLTGTLARTIAGGDTLYAGLALGLSDGSPDLGLSAGISRKF